MSSFNCPKCGKPILDTPKGYVTSCRHYTIVKPQGVTMADALMEIFGYKRVKVKGRPLEKRKAR